MSRWKVESLDYAKFTDGRPHVRIGLPEGFKKWLAWKPQGEEHEMFKTHAEAIAHAQAEALKAVAAKNQLPPREELS